MDLAIPEFASTSLVRNRWLLERFKLVVKVNKRSFPWTVRLYDFMAIWIVEDCNT